MHRTMLLALVSFVGLTAASCAHNHVHGTLAAKLNNGEALAYLGADEVTAGDKVDLFRNECRTVNHSKDISDDHCKKIKVGSGEVVRNLNQEYSVIRLAQGTTATEGLIVEKLKAN